jgi:DNA-directed RNA polymerases I, II, and III subunit RPABC2
MEEINDEFKNMIANDEEGNIDVNLSSDEDDDNETIMIQDHIEKDILDKYHPEVKQLNNNETDALTKIKRNDRNFIEDENHTTLPIMTRYEKAKVLGLRARQLNSGADAFIEVPPNIIDGITIANMELNQKKIPFIIRRPLPNGHSEYWKVKDLEILE